MLLDKDKFMQWSKNIKYGSLAWFAFLSVASISLQNIIFFGVAAWLIVMFLQRKIQLNSNLINWPLLSLALILVISSVWVGIINKTFFGFTKVKLMIIFFFTAAVVSHPLKAERYLNLFIVGASICAFSSVVKYILGIGGSRVSSFSGDYMAAGGMYMLGLTLALTRFIYGRGRQRWLWLVVALFLGLGLLLTYTRSSWLGALAAILVLGFFRDWKLPLGIILGLIVFLLIFPKHPISQRVYTLKSKYHGSNIERRYMWVSGLKMLKDHPLRGYGVDNLSRFYNKYCNPKAQEKNPPHVHNTFLQLSINGGLVAGGIYLWWIIVVIVTGYLGWKRNIKARPERAGSAIGITAAFIGFVVNGLFEFNFGTSQVISIIYFLMGLLPIYIYYDPLAPDWKLSKKPKILFLRPAGRGDVLLASPLPRLIKRYYPKAEVDILTEPATVGTAYGEEAWNNIFTLLRTGIINWWKTVKQIRSRNYEVVCDIAGDIRTASLTFISGGEFKVGPKKISTQGFYHFSPTSLESNLKSEWDFYTEILSSFGLKKLSLKPHWNIKAEDDRWVTEFLRERGVRSKKMIGIFPGASVNNKRWPLDNFLVLAKQVHKKLGMKAIFVFGPAEKDLKLEYMHAEGKLSLSVEGLPPARLAALWKHCVAIISNDAFPMHLGPAVGIPTIGLFGPTDPKVSFPYNKRSGHSFLKVEDVDYTNELEESEANNYWQKITPEQVLTELNNIVKRKEKSRKGK